MKTWWQAMSRLTVQHLWHDRPGNPVTIYSACGLSKHKSRLGSNEGNRCKNCERAIAK